VFRVSVVVGSLSMFALFGSNIFIPLLYQGLLGLSATASGIYMAPLMIAMVAVSLVTGQVVTRMDRYRFVSTASLAVLAVGLFLLSRVTPSSTQGEVVRDLVIVGLGFGGNQPIYQNAVMSAVPHRFVGVASSQFQFWRALGQTMGVTILGAILASQVGGVAPADDIGTASAAAPSLEALGHALQLLFSVAALAAAAGAVISLTLEEVPLRGSARSAPAIPAEVGSLGE
jgi:hypothetical protein